MTMWTLNRTLCSTDWAAHGSSSAAVRSKRESGSINFGVAVRTCTEFRRLQRVSLPDTRRGLLYRYRIYL